MYQCQEVHNLARSFTRYRLPWLRLVRSMMIWLWLRSVLGSTHTPTFGQDPESGWWTLVSVSAAPCSSLSAWPRAAQEQWQTSPPHLALASFHPRDQCQRSLGTFQPVDGRTLLHACSTWTQSTPAGCCHCRCRHWRRTGGRPPECGRLLPKMPDSQLRKG